LESVQNVSVGISLQLKKTVGGVRLAVCVVEVGFDWLYVKYKLFLPNDGE
jgi:hypothetical protein